MKRAGDQFRQSDTTFWGIAAICCGGLALLSVTLAALIPPNVLGGLHASRLEGATLNQLRAQVANLEMAAAELKRENDTLATRFALSEQQGGDVAQRVGAIEVAIPNLIEQSGGELVDPTTTASIPEVGRVSTEVEGGSVTIDQGPMIPLQPMPPATMPRVDGDAYAVALGIEVDAYGAPAAWAAMKAKVGTLLIGLTPVLADEADGTGKHLVAGPLPGFTEARNLCAHLAPVGIPCRPVPFVGTPLAP